MMVSLTATLSGFGTEMEVISKLPDKRAVLPILAARFWHFPKKPFAAKGAECGPLTAQVLVHVCVRLNASRNEVARETVSTETFRHGAGGLLPFITPKGSLPCSGYLWGLLRLQS
jgi:hypothetical protein